LSQHLPFKGPPKFTQTGIFGLKTNHLATLVCGSLLQEHCETTFKNFLLSQKSSPKNRMYLYICFAAPAAAAD
jgi:hypothetical protein